MDINRFKSPVFQVAIITNVMFILKVFGYLEIIGITEDSYQEVVIAITAIINALAAANNPTNSKDF